jgi:maltose alpha-D-glucosyltransferase/alpha-amylase
METVFPRSAFPGDGGDQTCIPQLCCYFPVGLSSNEMILGSHPTWYKDAIIYEVHVRAFFDSVKDGIGDFGGLTQKLGYLEELGVTAIWLLPFCPSPLRDDGYDISDYTNVHPSYGTLSDFQRFLKEAHRRGLRVITELVLNHTSDQHVWFQRSRRAQPGSRWRNFYVWSDTPDKYGDARIIFKDFESSNWTWDPIAKAYYWHRFYSHQPDLNWDNPEVREAMFAAMDFWFDLGVDGLRLDAVPYLIEREGTSCENLPETHAALRELRKHVDEKYRDRMLLAEANQWPEDAVAYFGKGDECHMAFHFPVMPRLFMGLRMEDRYPITDILRLTPSIPENCQWAMFLRNHDELTLEMVTDEERDYMYRTYAHDREMRINLGIRRRLAPLLENDRRKIELMNALLLSLPGTPVIYYGDEIGMGDNIFLGDRNGVRTPMQWSADRNAGFSRANPQRLYLPVNIDPEYHYEAVNVDAQLNNPHSLLWWTRRMIAQRKQFRAFGRGSMEFLYPSNRKILAFIRQFEDERILIVANLSRFTQCAELDLSKYQGVVPVEVFGHSKFPEIGNQPWFISLGPHAFYWFHLQPKEITQESLATERQPDNIPVIELESVDAAFSRGGLAAIARILPRALRLRPWFLGKGRTIRQVSFEDVINVPQTAAVILLAMVEYSDAEAETYVVPLSTATGEAADSLFRERPQTVLARVRTKGGSDAALYAAVFDRRFCEALLAAIARRRTFKAQFGEVVCAHSRSFRKAWQMTRSDLEPHPQPGDRMHSSVHFGEDFVLRLYRRVEPGVNPDAEVQEFLTEHTDFTNAPRSLGAIEYGKTSGDWPQKTTLGILTSYIRNATNGWPYTLDHLGLFFERALAIAPDDARMKDVFGGDPITLASKPVPPLLGDLLAGHAQLIRQLGRRTAELHQALSSHPEIPEFAPEPFTDFYRHGLYHGMLGQVGRTFEGLRSAGKWLPSAALQDARALLEHETEVRDLLRSLRDERVYSTRIRHHGDLHLATVLFTGNDVIFTNFGGDPARPMSERRIKRSPLRDVACMMSSFQYVAYAVRFGHVPGIVPGKELHPELEKWAQTWHCWVSALFLGAYLESAASDPFVPQSANELRILLQSYLLEKALLEIDYDLEHRPDWVRIPVNGIMQMLESSPRT